MPRRSTANMRGSRAWCCARSSFGSGESMTSVRILVDADACPVKEEVYKVAFRRGVPVKVVSNSHLRVPAHPLVERVMVSDKFDAADDWIVGEADAKTVVVTGDILLA